MALKSFQFHFFWDFFPPGVPDLALVALIMLTIFLKSLMELMVADPASPAVPGDFISVPLAPRVTDFLWAAELDLMRAPTADFLVEPFFPADLDFLAEAPPVTLALPLDPPAESLLKAPAPFSCLKTDSRLTKAECPSLNFQETPALTTPWETFPELLNEEISGAPALAPAAAEATYPCWKLWMQVLTSASL